MGTRLTTTCVEEEESVEVPGGWRGRMGITATVAMTTKNGAENSVRHRWVPIDDAAVISCSREHGLSKQALERDDV